MVKKVIKMILYLESGLFRKEESKAMIFETPYNAIKNGVLLKCEFSLG